MVVLTSFPPPEEGVKLKEDNVEAFISHKNLGVGSLYIAESRVSWTCAENGQGFSLEYPSIAIHAVSRDTSNFPKQCLFLMVEGNLDDDRGDREGGDDEEYDEGEVDATSTVRFVPADDKRLEYMFQAMSTCQSLHPDPNESPDDGDDYYGAVEIEEEVGAGDNCGTEETQNGHTDNTAEEETMDTDRFNDA